MANPTIEQVLHDYLIEVSDKLDSDTNTSDISKVSDFPRLDELMPAGVFNWKIAAQKIAEYEYYQVKFANLLSELMIKQTQARMYIHDVQVPGRTFNKVTVDNVNFSIARLNELSNIVKVRLESIEKCITALRTLKSDAPR